MKISSYAVKNYQFTLVIFIMIIVLGITTILTMPRSEDPEVKSPFFNVVVVYPGTSPKDMEDLVVDPLEKELSSQENIKRVRTSIGDGLAVIRVEYKYRSNVDDKYQEVLRVVNGKRDELPENINIDVMRQQPSDVNIMQIALVSETASKDKLQYYAEKLQDDLETIKELKNVEIHGLPDRQVRIELNLEKIAQMGLPVYKVISSIQNEISNIPGGSIEAGNRTYNIKSSGSYQRLDEIKNTIVFNSKGKNIFLPGAKRRQIDREFIKAVIEVLTELPFPVSFLQVFIRRHDDPYIRICLLIAADTFEFSFLDHAQQCSLHIE